MASNEWLVRKLHEQDKKIEALSRGGTGVGHTSIAPGENLTVISGNGEVVLGAGGVEHVDGPTPATPSAPTLKLGFGTIETTWDGTFAEGEDEDGVPLTAPVDFDVVEVHCSTDPEEEEWGDDTMRGQIKTREGGTITVGGFDVDDEVFVCLIALAKTGKRSAPSATASLIIEGLDFAQLTNELDAATVTIDNAREVLLDGQNTLGEKLDAADTALSDLESTLGELDSTTLPALRSDLDAAEGRLDTAEGQITDAFGEIQDARSDAAADATSKADAAKSAAESYADGLKTQIDSTIDTTRTELEGDISAAQADATQALTSASTKNKVTRSTSRPPAVYDGRVDDVWFTMSSMGSGGRVLFQEMWNGNTWVSVTIDSDVIAYLDAAKITTGFLDVATLIRAGSITVDKVLVGAGRNIIPWSQVLSGQTVLPHINENYYGSGTTNVAPADASKGVPIHMAHNRTTDDPGVERFIVSLKAGPVAQGNAVHRFSVSGGTWSFRVQAYTNVANLKARLSLVWYTASFAYGGQLNGELTSVGTTPTKLECVATLPDQAAYMVPFFRTNQPGETHWVNPELAPAVGSTLIEDGAITTGKLTANAVTAGKIAAGAVEAGHIKAGAITIGTVTNLQSNLDAKETPSGAQSKATAAQNAAVSAAATDATSKANQAVTTAGANAASQYGETKNLVSGWKTPGQTTIAGGQIQTESVSADKLAANVLEVGNLKAGTAAIAEAVVQKIAASTASIQQADVKNLFVTGTSSLSDVVAERIAAETAEFIQLEVGNLVAGTGTMNTATINKLFSDVVVASMAQAEQFIGENAILTGAVTAPKITASEELWAKIAEFVKIRAEHIEADAIDGMVITAPTLRSAESGRRWIGDPNGIRIINEDDDVRTQLSPDGSTFKGEVEADTLVVNDGAEFKGNNTLAQGAKLTLAAGVTDPTAPPVVQPYWNGVDFTPSGVLPGMSGLAWDGTHYWTVRPGTSNGPSAIHRINPATGEDTLFAAPNYAADRFGVTCIGSELFWLERAGYNHKVIVTDLNCVKKREFTIPEADTGHTASNPLVYKPGIGNDGTNVVIAHCSDDGTLRVRTYNKTTGAKIGTITANDTIASDIAGVYVGDGDFGSTHIVCARSSNDSIIRYTASGVRVADGGWYAANPNSTGVVYVGGKFRTLDPSGVIHEYADNNTGDGSADWWAGYGWWKDVDSDLVAETSDYQSRMSPPAQFTWPRRAGIKIIGQSMPTGADYLMPCLAKKTTAPVRTDFHVPSWEVAAGKPVARVSVLPTDWSNKISPPSVNTFPEGTSSVLESASGTFQVKGDGSGHWGPLTMGRNGIMSGLIATGELNAYVDTGGSTKTFTVQLPSGRFTKPPLVWAAVGTSAPQLCSVGIPRGEITTTTFTLFFNRTNTTATPVYWFAMDSE